MITISAPIRRRTLLLGAVIGSAKDDMKKVLAASTMSQIGYMMLGAGLGPIGYALAIFHLLTHGFFKAQLFLGAGSVMHAMGDQVDMRRFGALAGAMRITWATMGIGWLAILGVPPFSGFWSKDRLIEAAFTGEGVRPWILGGVALVGAGLTAFYMSRLFFMIFHGKQRWTTDKDLEGEVHPHESGWLMTLPLIVLSVFSVGLGGLLTYDNMFVTWLEPVTGHAEHGEPVLPVAVIMGATLALVALSVVDSVLDGGAEPNDYIALSFVLGIFMFSIYGMAVAQTHDRFPANEALEATRGLLLLHGVGAAIGPLLSGLAMQYLGTQGFPQSMGVFTVLLVIFVWWRIHHDDPVPLEERSPFHVASDQVSPVGVEMDPRADSPLSESPPPDDGSSTETLSPEEAATAAAEAVAVAQNVASEAAEAAVRQQEEAAQQTATQPEAQSPKKPETRWDRIRHFIRRHVTQGNNDSMD